MKSLKQLVRKFGDEKKIPDGELEKAGLVRWGDLVLSRREYEEVQRLPVQEDEERIPTPEEIKRERIERRKEEVYWGGIRSQREEQLNGLFAGPAGRYLSLEQQQKVARSLEQGDFFSTPLGIEEELGDFEEIVFLEKANTFFGRNNRQSPIYAPNAIGNVVEKWVNGAELDVEEAIFEEESQALRDKQNAFDENQVPDQIKADFEGKYGSIKFAGGGPFRSYSFKRVVLEQKEPSTFWGKSLFGMRRKFLDKFEGVEGIEKIANYIFDSEAGYFGENVFTGNGSGGLGLEALFDNIPERIEEFEDDMNYGGAAIAFLQNEGFCIDDDWFGQSEWMRKVLLEMQKKEFPELFQRKIKPTHLDELVKSESKKSKILRLSNSDQDYDTLVRKTIEGDVHYVDSLLENQQVTQELQALGVNTQEFYSGLPQREFVVENGKKIDLEEMKKSYLAEYKASLEQMLSGNAVNAPERLEAKLTEAVKKTGAIIPEGKSFREHLLELEDETQLRAVCNTCAEYSSRAQNVRDEHATAAAMHHFRNLRNLFKSKPHKEDSTGRYSIKHSAKNPLTDVDIGNDAGCCIGIYDDYAGDIWENARVDRFIEYLEKGVELDQENTQPVDSNGVYIPFYFKDRATQFLEIYRGDERSGLALMFAGKNERNEPTLIVNSIELSDRLRSDPHKAQVLEETVKYIREYAEKSGFKHIVLSKHDYNPGASVAGNSPDFETFIKIHPWEDNFYSDIVKERENEYSANVQNCGVL